MKIIIIFLCALSNLVTGQTTNDIHSAKIFTKQKIVSENSDLDLKCSVFGPKKDTLAYMYLCKDGLGIMKRKLKQDPTDVMFTISRVSFNDSGNYSCVYSMHDHPLTSVTKKGVKTIHIQVLASILPADLSIIGSSTVSEGDKVKLICTLSENMQIFGGCELVHSYLVKNVSVHHVQAFDVKQMKATFTIEGVIMRDSGPYSCVVLPFKCIEEHETTLRGNNQVLITVKESVPVREILLIGAMSFLLLLVLSVLTMKMRAVWDPAIHCECLDGETEGEDREIGPGTTQQLQNSVADEYSEPEYASPDEISASLSTSHLYAKTKRQGCRTTPL